MQMVPIRGLIVSPDRYVVEERLTVKQSSSSSRASVRIGILSQSEESLSSSASDEEL